MRFERDMLLLYAVTDRAWTGKKTLDGQVEKALQGGVTLVQLREKHLSKEQLIEEARRITELCHRYGVPLIVNDDYEAALAAGADGVHVGIEDAPVAAIRARAGKNFIIGATAKTVEQAQRAEHEGADYLGVGAVFPSPTKQSAIRITNEQLRTICASVTIPAVAIGGITQKNVASLKGSDMAGIAVVSAIFGADNILAAARSLKERAIEVTRGEA